MIFLLLLGAVFAVFFIAALVGSGIGLAIGVARFVRNPASLLTYYKEYLAAKRAKIYGR